MSEPAFQEDKTMLVTTAKLRDLGACRDQVDLFVALFGESVEVTKALCIEHAQKFNWNWAAKNLLPKTARAEYDHATASAWDEYDHAKASARAEYERTKASAFARAALLALARECENE